MSATAISTTAVPRLTRTAFRSWIAGLDAFLFDCDGVLWRGDALIPGTTAMLELLRSLNKRVVFVTNNSTKTRETYVKKLASHGIVAAADDIVTSAWATAQYMKQEGIPSGSKVYYVGESGLGQELANVGYVPLGLDHSDVRELPTGPFTVDKEIKAVVVGLDRYVSFYKVAYASTCVRQIPGCRFIGTNPDPTFPVDGAILPAGGSLVRFVEIGAGCITFLTVVFGKPCSAPEAVVGKPSQDLLKTILATYKLNPQRTCMVGDRLSTDIEFGKRGGLHTLLVLSGVTLESELSNIADPSQVPDFVVDSVNTINTLHAETTE